MSTLNKRLIEGDIIKFVDGRSMVNGTPAPDRPLAVAGALHCWGTPESPRDAIVKIRGGALCASSGAPRS